MRASYRPLITGAAAVALLAGSVSCGDVVRPGKAPLLASSTHCKPPLVQSLENMGRVSPVCRPDARRPASRGRGPLASRSFSTTWQRRTMRMIPKDAGGRLNLNPTPWNAVTINRLSHHDIRADGRNTPGVEVPFPIDGAVDRKPFFDTDRCAVRDCPSPAEARPTAAIARELRRTAVHLDDRRNHVLRRGI